MGCLLNYSAASASSSAGHHSSVEQCSAVAVSCEWSSCSSSTGTVPLGSRSPMSWTPKSLQKHSCCRCVVFRKQSLHTRSTSSPSAPRCSFHERLSRTARLTFALDLDKYTAPDLLVLSAQSCGAYSGSERPDRGPWASCIPSGDDPVLAGAPSCRACKVIKRCCLMCCIT